MRRFLHAIKFAAPFALAMALLISVPAQSNAQSGTVRLHVVKAGFILGFGGGSGSLWYHGHHYRLSIGGVGIGSLGVAAVDLVGTAYNLRSPADIVGTYSVAGAGAAIVGGAAVARLQNEKGVVLEVHGVQAGLQVSLGLGGMTISFR
jgi:hypothetical protein